MTACKTLYEAHAGFLSWLCSFLAHLNFCVDDPKV